MISSADAPKRHLRVQTTQIPHVGFTLGNIKVCDSQSTQPNGRNKVLGTKDTNLADQGTLLGSQRQQQRGNLYFVELQRRIILTVGA
jgi:hypothetical protein